jgi:hypothetical protein
MEAKEAIQADLKQMEEKIRDHYQKIRELEARRARREIDLARANVPTTRKIMRIVASRDERARDYECEELLIIDPKWEKIAVQPYSSEFRDYCEKLTYYAPHDIVDIFVDKNYESAIIIIRVLNSENMFECASIHAVASAKELAKFFHV